MGVWRISLKFGYSYSIRIFIIRIRRGRRRRGLRRNTPINRKLSLQEWTITEIKTLVRSTRRVQKTTQLLGEYKNKPMTKLLRGMYHSYSWWYTRVLRRNNFPYYNFSFFGSRFEQKKYIIIKLCSFENLKFKIWITRQRLWTLFVTNGIHIIPAN